MLVNLMPPVEVEPILREPIIVVAPTPTSGSMVVHPRYRQWLSRCGLTTAEAILNLPGEVVSGHPNRHVVQVKINTRTLYLKREHAVGWRVRLRNWLDDFGPISRSEREAKTLQQLEAKGLPAPHWIAYGSDGAGRAFLLVDELVGHQELRERAADPNRTTADRRVTLEQLVSHVAKLHTAGFTTPDLAAKHIFLRGQTPVILDWQSSLPQSATQAAPSLEALAHLNATVADWLATPRERLRFLFRYLRQTNSTELEFRPAVERIASITRKLRTKSSIREQCQPNTVKHRLVWLDGEQVCAIPEVAKHWPTPAIGEPFYTMDTKDGERLVIRLSDDRPATLLRYRTIDPVGRGLAVVRGKAWRSPAAKLSRMLFALQKAGVEVPQPHDCRFLPPSRSATDRDVARNVAWEHRETQRTSPTPRPSRCHVANSARHGVCCRNCREFPNRSRGEAHSARRRSDRKRQADSPMQRRSAKRKSCRHSAIVRDAILEDRHPARPAGLRTEEGSIDREHPPPSDEFPMTVTPRVLTNSSSDSDQCRVASIEEFAEFAGPDWVATVLTDPSPEELHAKQGRTISLWTLTANDGRTLRMYLKRHFRLPRWHGWLAKLLPGRAWSPGLQEWHNLNWATANGIPVARPIAAAEFRGPWGRLQSFLAVEELANQLPLHQAIPLAFNTLTPSDFALWKRRLIAELARLSRELHRRSAFHKDLYLCHFYLPEADCTRVPDEFQNRVSMIDFHRLSRHRLGKVWFQVKDLGQLLFSTDGVAGLTNRDSVRFWKLYREGDWHDARRPREWIRGAILKKWKLYRRHNEKHAVPRQ
jgi:tRNA A-37 threonylcarbamoyl transferase component Bud32